MDLYDLLAACGVVGALLCCGAYLGLHYHRVSLLAYAWLNLASSALCGASLCAQFNLGGLLIEAFFAAVSGAVILKNGGRTNGSSPAVAR